MAKRSALIAGSGAALLAGCATVTPPALPLTAYAASDCAARPDLAGARSLVPERDVAIWTVTNELGELSPCLDWNGARGPYMVFALPEEQWPAPIEIGASLEGLRIFSPHVMLLDAEGNEVRSFSPEHYHFRSFFYSVQFLPQPGERYALVTSNPARIGTSYEGIRTGTSTTMIYTGYTAMAWTSGLESHINSAFSYSGTVRASVYRPREEEEDAPE